WIRCDDRGGGALSTRGGNPRLEITPPAIPPHQGEGGASSTASAPSPSWGGWHRVCGTLSLPHRRHLPPCGGGQKGGVCLCVGDARHHPFLHHPRLRAKSALS